MMTNKKKRKRQRDQRLLLGLLLLVVVAVVFSACMKKSGDDAEETSAEAMEEQAETEKESETTEEAKSAEEEAAELEALEQSTQMHRLEWELEEYLSHADGTWSVYVKNLDTDLDFSMNNQPMYAASLIKLFVMESAYENMELLEQNDSRYSSDTARSQEKIESLLESMIEVSDNESYNELVRIHSADGSFVEGCQYIEDHLAERGYTDTGIFHTLSPSETEPEYIADADNCTSVEDCGKLLESIYRGTCVSEEASKEMLDFLLHQETTYKIPSGVPDRVQVANKTGETSEVEHDVAIVFGEETDYILCVMSSDFEETDAAVDTIQQISTLVYAALNK